MRSDSGARTGHREAERQWPQAGQPAEADVAQVQRVADCPELLDGLESQHDATGPVGAGLDLGRGVQTARDPVPDPVVRKCVGEHDRYPGRALGRLYLAATGRDAGDRAARSRGR